MQAPTLRGALCAALHACAAPRELCCSRAPYATARVGSSNKRCQRRQMCASLWLPACCIRSHAHSSLRALYIVARSPACSSFFLVLSYRTLLCQFLASTPPLRLVCCAFAPLLLRRLCCTSLWRLSSSALLSASAFCSALSSLHCHLSLDCSVSASRLAFETSTDIMEN